MSNKKYTDFHSNYLEDKWISENLDLPEKGFFVDVGASDAIKRSNTYHFEMNDWDGICIEADKFYFSTGEDTEGGNNPLPEFRKKSIHAAVGEEEKEILFVSWGTRKALSHVYTEEFFPGDIPKNSFKVKCYKLETILQEHNVNHIDILDIACRSQDWSIWNSFDYLKYIPKVIITEHTSRGHSRDERVHDFLITTGEYDLCHTTKPYYIFKHNSVEYK
tara:strand:+ start:217 stop:873 length:657 start_codon:yes stop_codon:yes gene_type:complete